MSDFLDRMVQQARGTGEAVQPMVAPVFALEPATKNQHPSFGEGEPIESGSVRGTGSRSTADATKLLTAGSTEIPGGPPVRKDLVHAGSKAQVSKTAQVERGAESMGQESEPHLPVKGQGGTGPAPLAPHENYQASLLRAAGVSISKAERAFDTPLPSDQPDALPPQRGKLARVATPGVNQERVLQKSGPDALQGPETTRADSSAPAAVDRSPSQGSKDAFALASQALRRRAQQPGNNLLKEDSEMPQGIEGGKQAQAASASSRKDSTGLPLEGVRPRTVLHREQPALSHGEAGIPAGGEAPAPATIQVHIGRIEVRATPAPVQTRTKTTQQAESASLDEYLRKHSGGGR